MAEIAVLREHIVNYAKTRDTYVAYRKAGYSKKFLAEHESEITIHKAAKNYKRKTMGLMPLVRLENAAANISGN